MDDIRNLARIQLGVIVLFAFFKFIRPSVLKGTSAQWIKTTLLSLPNFFEGIIGVIVLTTIGLVIHQRIEDRLKKRLDIRIVYFIALLLSGIYVISQELKIHNLGGNNVYDKNDSSAFAKLLVFYSPYFAPKWILIDYVGRSH